MFSTLSVKTRSDRRILRKNEYSHMMWITQIPMLAIAYYEHQEDKSAKFYNVQVRDKTLEIRGWEDKNLEDLSRLASLLTWVIDVVKTKGNGRAILEHGYTGGPKLKIFAESSLPKDLYAKWGGGSPQPEVPNPEVPN